MFKFLYSVKKKVQNCQCKINAKKPQTDKHRPLPSVNSLFADRPIAVNKSNISVHSQVDFDGVALKGHVHTMMWNKYEFCVLKFSFRYLSQGLQSL